jgi:hypothetical protein
MDFVERGFKNREIALNLGIQTGTAATVETPNQTAGPKSVREFQAMDVV